MVCSGRHLRPTGQNIELWSGVPLPWRTPRVWKILGGNLFSLEISVGDLFTSVNIFLKLFPVSKIQVGYQLSPLESVAMFISSLGAVIYSCILSVPSEKVLSEGEGIVIFKRSARMDCTWRYASNNYSVSGECTLGLILCVSDILYASDNNCSPFRKTLLFITTCLGLKSRKGQKIWCARKHIVIDSFLLVYKLCWLGRVVGEKVHHFLLRGRIFGDILGMVIVFVTS